MFPSPNCQVYFVIVPSLSDDAVALKTTLSGKEPMFVETENEADGLIVDLELLPQPAGNSVLTIQHKRKQTRAINCISLFMGGLSPDVLQYISQGVCSLLLSIYFPLAASYKTMKMQFNDEKGQNLKKYRSKV